MSKHIDPKWSEMSLSDRAAAINAVKAKLTGKELADFEKALLIQEQQRAGTIPSPDAVKPDDDGCIVVVSEEHGGRTRIRATEYDPAKHKLPA